MALAKYAEDNLEIFYERMAMKDYPIKQECKPQVNAAKPEKSQNEKKIECFYDKEKIKWVKKFFGL